MKLFDEIKKDKGWFITYLILTLVVIINNAYLIYNIAGLYNIENALRLTVCIITVIVTILFVFLAIKSLLKRKKKYYIPLLLITLILSGIVGFINVNFNIIYNKLNKVSSSYTTYSISLVTQSNNSVNSIEGVNNEDIAIINDHEIANGYNFGLEILKDKKMNNTLKEYESYTEILDALLDGNITYAFLPSNYKDAFTSIEGYEDIIEKLKTIYTQSKQEENIVSNKDITGPFTVLLMGVDSEKEGISNATANGDSLILVTFNPKTLNATMLSIPRDSYVPITCMANKKNKITHSSWGGEKCIINTVEKFTGIDIDYYAKINFQGIVKLVDTLGGIQLDIPYSFCESDSLRRFGQYTIYVEKGFQTLNGEQALAYSRNRHPNPEYCSSKWTNYDSNDFVRGQHQQEVIKAILDKIKDIRDLDKFYSLLDTISSNMETNMDSNTILSFYNVAKDIVSKSKNSNSINDIINIQKLYLSGYGAMIYDYSQLTGSGMKMILYNFVPYQGSLNDIVNAMKVNLELKDKEVIKTFSYDINNPYEEVIIGQKYYNESSIKLLPDFTGKTKSYVESYATANGLKITFVTQESSSTAGTVIAQDPPAKMDLNNISSTKGLTITISSGPSQPTITNKYSICKDKENSKESICQILIAKYIGEKYTTFTSLKIDSEVANIITEQITEGATKDNDGLIISINGETEGKINLTETNKIIVKYYHYVEVEEKPVDTPSNEEIPGTSGDIEEDS